jgi:cytochrome c biogenesis protein CcmG, thiol:disulfide interchange protein DsbE
MEPRSRPPRTYDRLLAHLTALTMKPNHTSRSALLGLPLLCLCLSAFQSPKVQDDSPPPRPVPQGPAPKEKQSVEIPAAWRSYPNDETRGWLNSLEGKAPPALSTLVNWTSPKPQTWAGLKGKFVLIDMWATWCRPCMASLPKIDSLQNAYPDDLVVLGVHVERAYTKLSMETTAAKKGMTWPLAGDPDSVFSKALGVSTIPAYYVVDRDGVLQVAGAHPNHLADIMTALMGPPKVAIKAAPVKDWPGFPTKKLFATNDLRGKKAPELSVEKWFAKEPDTEGKVVLIEFWTTNIRTSRERMSSLNTMYMELKDDLVIIGITADKFDKARGFWYSQGTRYFGATDRSKKMYDEIGIEAIPHSLLISSDGIVRWQGYPDDQVDPLTMSLVRDVIATDKAASAKRKADGKPAPKVGEKPKDKPAPADKGKGYASVRSGGQ